MKYPIDSHFPAQVDERTFFSDADLDTIIHHQNYHYLLHRQQYTDAVQYLEASPAHSYSAGLFNYIEAKIHTLQQYVLEQERYNPYYTTEEEPDILVDEFWI